MPPPTAAPAPLAAPPAVVAVAHAVPAAGAQGMLATPQEQYDLTCAVCLGALAAHSVHCPHDERHVFCYECMRKFAATNEEENGKGALLSCPTCKRPTEGIDSWPQEENLSTRARTALVVCKECGEEVPFCKQDEHRETTCAAGLVKCDFPGCRHWCRRDQLPAHRLDCYEQQKLAMQELRKRLREKEDEVRMCKRAYRGARRPVIVQVPSSTPQQVNCAELSVPLDVPLGEGLRMPLGFAPSDLCTSDRAVDVDMLSVFLKDPARGTCRLGALSYEELVREPYYSVVPSDRALSIKIRRVPIWLRMRTSSNLATHLGRNVEATSDSRTWLSVDLVSEVEDWATHAVRQRVFRGFQIRCFSITMRTVSNPHDQDVLLPMPDRAASVGKAFKLRSQEGGNYFLVDALVDCPTDDPEPVVLRPASPVSSASSVAEDADDFEWTPEMAHSGVREPWG